MVVACLFQHSCRGLAGLRPSAFSEVEQKGGPGGWRGGQGWNFIRLD